MNSLAKKTVTLLIAAVMMAGLIGCSGQPLSTREKGTGIGALVGAGTGAIIGAAVGAPGVGALVGGAIGTAGGFAVGNYMQNQDTQHAQTQSQIQNQQGEIEQQRRQIEQLKSQSETE
jgi:phage tail tape-measure protein